MIHGKTELAAIEQSSRSGQPIPAPILNAPEVEMGLELYLKAFWELSTCRTFTGFGQGPIPWSAVATYCSFHGMEPDETEDFFYVINKVDDAFLKALKEKRDREKPQDGAKPPPGKRGRRGPKK